MRRYLATLMPTNYSSRLSFYAVRYHGVPILRTNYFAEAVSKFLATIEKPEKSAAFFDIDNTLLVGLGYKPKNPAIRMSGYGSDRWFSDQEKKIKQSANAHQQFMMLLAEYYAIQPHLQQITTEECVPEKLSELKKIGIPIFGLTARSFCIAELSRDSLKKQGIEFTQNQDKVVESEFFHQHGITFCNGRSKKEGLKSFLKTPLGRHSLFGVTQVLFVDDKESHCKEMKAFFDEKNIHSVVAHYTRVETLLPMASESEIEKNREALMQDCRLSLPRI